MALAFERIPQRADPHDQRGGSSGGMFKDVKEI